MPADVIQDNLAQAIFAFFAWQADVVAEITAPEAEAFFRLVEKDTVLDEKTKIELQKSYPKLWREYIRTGPLAAAELRTLVQQIPSAANSVLRESLDLLYRAAPRRKRKKIQKLHQALLRLITGNEDALPQLRELYQQSRFGQVEPESSEPATAPMQTVVTTETTDKVVEGLRFANEAAQAEITAQAVPGSEQRVLAVHKMVPWTEHDAVSPEKLQFWTKGARLMRCIGIVDRSHDFRSFQFVSDEPTLFFYKPGQFITLEIVIDGKRYLRSYTISSSPSRPHLIEISVKRVKGGIVSNYLHDHLGIGDSVLMKPPGGKFHCFDTVGDKYLFLAAGSGITPMLSMARWWHDIGAQPDVIFYHSVREPEDAVFTEDMVAFTSTNRRFKYIASFTSPHLPEHWPGMKGRFSEEKLLQIAPDFQERMVFTCGPDSFMRNIKLILEKNGFDIKERFRQESFGAPRPQITPEQVAVTTGITKPIAPTRADFDKPVRVSDASVHFSLSALEIFGGDMDIPILELAEEVGVEIASSCRSGSCGTCRVLKTRGEIECDDAPALTDADREAGYILTCVSRARGYVELEV